MTDSAKFVGQLKLVASLNYSRSKTVDNGNLEISGNAGSLLCPRFSRFHADVMKTAAQLAVDVQLCRMQCSRRSAINHVKFV